MNKVEWTVADDNRGWYGGDITHALSAWTSTSHDLTDEKRARIPAMLKFLATNDHGTPFEKSYLGFTVTCDTASHIHLLKHRIGVSINGESARYKELKDDKFHIPADWPLDWKGRMDRDSSSGQKTYHNAIDKLTNFYKFDKKRAKESARFFLTYSNQLTLDVSFNFRSFIHFQGLRNNPDAQLEIREIADKMLNLVKEIEVFKYSLEAFGYEKKDELTNDKL